MTILDHLIKNTHNEDIVFMLKYLKAYGDIPITEKGKEISNKAIVALNKK